MSTFYASTPWKKLRALKRRAHPLCEDCLDPPCAHGEGPGHGESTETIDHVVPLTENRGLALVWENLRALCWACHNTKAARSGRGR